MKKQKGNLIIALILVLLASTIVVIASKISPPRCCACPPDRYKLYPLSLVLFEKLRAQYTSCQCPPEMGCALSFWVIPIDLIGLNILLTGILLYGTLSQMWFKIGVIGGFWGLISSILSLENLRHTEALWWISGRLYEKVILLPAYLTNLIGNPFMPILTGEGVVITPTSAVVYHIAISILLGFAIGAVIGLVVNKFKK